MDSLPRQLSLTVSLAAGLAWALAANGAAGTLLACRGIIDQGARLSCYDALTDESSKAGPAPASAPAPTPAPVAAAAAPVATDGIAATASRPEATPPVPSPEELFGRDPVESEGIVRHAAGIEPVDELHAHVANAQVDASGKLIVTLDNGQVWSQIDSPPLNLKNGAEVRIHRAAMGSYLLTGAESKRSIRVRRSK
jgi:hypothetical protein